jgi:ATP-dependent DNA helicase RecG
MKKQCIEANLPAPTISVKGHDFWIVFRKDIYFPEYLTDLGLNERQADALIYFKAKGEITSSEYAQKYKVSDRTARRDLSELVEKELLKNEGDTNLSKYIFV